VTGVLATCGSGWCLDATALDFGSGADLTLTQGDYNGDGQAESVDSELTSMIGQTFTLSVDAVGGSSAAPGDTQSSRALSLSAGAYTITISSTGVVTSIDGLQYLVTPG
jgi:hypothetical protein